MIGRSDRQEGAARRDYPVEGAGDQYSNEEWNVAWLCEMCPEFFDGWKLEDLEPDRFPEHRVVAEFIRRRESLVRALGGEAGHVRVSAFEILSSSRSDRGNG
jgi:hypothetical protein